MRIHRLNYVWLWLSQLGGETAQSHVALIVGFLQPRRWRACLLSDRLSQRARLRGVVTDRSLSLEFLGVVDEAGLVDGAAEEGGGPLVAGEGRGTGEEQEVQSVTVNAEGAAAIHVD